MESMEGVENMRKKTFREIALVRRKIKLRRPPGK